MRRDMPFLDMSLAIGGHLGNMQIKKLFFDIVSPPKQRPDHSGVRYIVCITRTL